MDLTPRTPSDEAAQPAKTKRRWVPALIVVLALGSGAVVVTKFLTSAIDYYCNVDEVGVKHGCTGTRAIRVQGVVKEHTVTHNNGDTQFVMEFNHKSINVNYTGDPGGLFQECIPVVAHGQMLDGVFKSDDIEVKHSNAYVQKNKARMDAANKEAAACSVQGG